MISRILQSSHVTRIYKISPNPPSTDAPPEQREQPVVVKVYFQDDEEPAILNSLQSLQPKHLMHSIPTPQYVKRFLYDQMLTRVLFVTMPYGGPDLIEVFQAPWKGLDRVTVYRQMFAAVEEFHALLGRAHGDIKLENFVLCPDTLVLRLIDFQTHAHSEGCRSIRHHQTYNSLPSDDFESLGYAILHSFVGEDLWFNRERKVLEAKLYFIYQLQSDDGVIKTIQQYLRLCREDSFDRQAALRCIDSLGDQ